MRVRFVTTLEKEIIRKVKIQAAVESRNVNDLLEEIIEKYIEEGQNDNNN